MSDQLGEFVAKYETITGHRPVRFGHREWRALCPVHEMDGAQHKPSMALWARPDGSVAYNCMSGRCSHHNVTSALHNLGMDVRARHLDFQSKHEARVKNGAHRLARLQEAATIYAGLRSIRISDPVAKYCESRVLRELTNEKFILTNERGTELVGVLAHPASIFAPTIELTGLSILTVDSDGQARRNKMGKRERQVIGVMKGSGVMLGQWSTRMMMGEGIETTRAAMLMYGVGFGIAAISAVNMINIEPPPGVETVFIAVDNDTAGIENSKATAERLRAKGYTAQWVCWGLPGDDAADEWARRCLTGAHVTSIRETA